MTLRLIILRLMCICAILWWMVVSTARRPWVQLRVMAFLCGALIPCCVCAKHVFTLIGWTTLPCWANIIHSAAALQWKDSVNKWMCFSWELHSLPSLRPSQLFQSSHGLHEAACQHSNLFISHHYCLSPLTLCISVRICTLSSNRDLWHRCGLLEARRSWIPL